MAQQDAVLDYREPEWVAEKLGLDKNTVYKYLQEGWLPGVQLGRKWLISERLLAEFLEAETRRQTQVRRKELAFTARLHRVMDVALDTATGYRHDYVGTEHLLIGIAEVEDSLGAKVLRNLGVDLSKIRGQFESLSSLQGKFVAGAKPAPRKPQLTDRARQALQFAQEQAVGMGHDYLGAEHLLLGLMLEPEGFANRILNTLNVTFEQLRAEVAKLVRVRE